MTGLRTCEKCGKLFKKKDAGPELVTDPKPVCAACSGSPPKMAGHSFERFVACPACGDMDGCHKWQEREIDEEKEIRATREAMDTALAPFVGKPNSPDLMAEIQRVLRDALRPLTFAVPKVEPIPPQPGDDPLMFRAKITNIPPEWFVGKTAGQMRAIGITTIDPSIPDDCVLKKDERGRCYFDVVVVEFTLTPTGAELPPEEKKMTPEEEREYLDGENEAGGLYG